MHENIGDRPGFIGKSRKGKGREKRGGNINFLPSREKKDQRGQKKKGKEKGK